MGFSRLIATYIHQATQLGGVADLVLGLAEDHRDEPRALAEGEQRIAVVALQLGAVAGGEAAPAVRVGDHAWPAEQAGPSSSSLRKRRYVSCST